MRVIWKYKVVNGVAHQIPGEYPEVVHVAKVNGEIFAWVEVEPGEPHTTVQFHVIATGEVIPDHTFYAGTVFDGPYVWHICTQDSTPDV